MSTISLDLANRIIDAVLRRAAEIDCRPISVIVVEPGCKVKAFQKEDGSSMIRFEMAFGKAYAALALGRSSKLVRVRAEERPLFMRYLMSATDEQIFPEGGGLQIRGLDGEVIGAVGVTGDTEDREDRRGFRRHGTPCRRPADQQVGRAGEFGIQVRRLHHPQHLSNSNLGDTQKYALSPPYAAPERWRGARAITATDKYSFGVMAFELLSN
jgi:uncharacterized protein GlcG (DUF336 family)